MFSSNCVCVSTKVSKDKLTVINSFARSICKNSLLSPPHDPTDLNGPGSPYCWGFTITLRHTKIDRTHLDEWSARRSDLYLTKHNSHKMDIRAPDGIQTYNTSKRAVAVLRLGPHCHLDQNFPLMWCVNVYQ